MKNFKKLLFITLASVSVLFTEDSKAGAVRVRSKLQQQQEAERQNRKTLKMNNIKNMINKKKDIFLEKMEGFINVSINRELDGLEQRLETVQTIEVFNKNLSNIDKRISSIDQKVDHLEQRLDLILSKLSDIFESIITNLK